MAKVTYIQFNGSERTIDVKKGLSVMEGATKNNVPGIVAECGGSCSCATCHVYVDEAWVAKTGSPSPMEQELLDCVPVPGPGSRLSCQIIVKDDLDGLVVRIPESQY